MTNRGVTARAVLVGSLLLPVNIYWIVYMELVRGGIWPTVMTLLFTATTSLFLLMLLNMLVGRTRPRSALTRGELLTIYTMLSVGSALAGTDVLQTLISLMGRSTYYATPENGWASRVTPLLPDWLMVKDKAVLKPYYEGTSTLYRPEYLMAWIPPLLRWLGFIGLMLTAMFSLNVLMRRQWADAERLSYPIISLPIELTRTDPPFLKQPMLWLGFAVAGSLDLLNGIHHLAPSTPAINTKILISLGDVFVAPPWNGVGWMPIAVYPFAIGLGFLIPLDLVFSCWFFYLVWKLERVAVAYFAWDPACMRASFDGPYSQEQVAGVWVATIAFMVWTGRNHVRLIVAALRRGGARDPAEAMTYRVAAVLALSASAGMSAFLIAAGMTPSVAVFYVVVYLALSLYLARVRSEVGPPAHDMYGSGPDTLLTYTVGPAALSPGTKGVLASLYWLNRESCRSHPMPAHAEALKASGAVGINPKRLWVLLLATALVGAALAMWACLHLGYRLGAMQFMGPAPWFANEGMARLDTWTTNPPPPLSGQRWALAAGAAVGFLGMAARAQWLWFPLHPVGYAVSGWWAINLFWFPLFLATILKGLILRYGGLRFYRRVLPFFLGLILGEFVVGGLWQLAGALLGMNTYAFWI